MELTETAVYFSLIEALAKKKAMEWSALVNEAGVDSGTASKYTSVLQDLGIVEKIAPAFAPRGRGRRHRYRVKDHPTRFWFRFVFPYQEALSSALSPETHYARNVEPHLAEFVSSTFEDLCRAWAARQYRHTTDSVDSWWGNALNRLRAAGSRTSEEIDLVGSHRRAATLIGEVTWRGLARPCRNRSWPICEHSRFPRCSRPESTLGRPRSSSFRSPVFRESLRRRRPYRG